MKISVIIPVYNAEKYLKECIDSVLSQTYKNYEIIMINDGSTDSSRDICKQYEAMYENIKLIEIQNHGPSYARNIGIKEAGGDYIYFMDSDDIVLPNCFEEFYKAKVDCDELYCFKWQMYYKNSKINIENMSVNYVEYSDVEYRILMDGDVSSYLWNKFYSRKIIIDKNLTFDTAIHYCEDKIFNKEYIKYIKKIYYNCNLSYLYRMRKSSLTGNYICERNLSVFKACAFIINNTKDRRINDYYTWLYIMNYEKFKDKYPGYDYDLEYVSKKNKLIKSKNISFKMKIKIITIGVLPFLFNLKKKVKKNLYE